MTTPKVAIGLDLLAAATSRGGDAFDGAPFHLGFTPVLSADAQAARVSLESSGTTAMVMKMSPKTFI